MYILIALGAVIVLWFVVKPSWAPKPPERSEIGEKAGELTKNATEKASSLSKSVTNRAGKISKAAGDRAGELYGGLRGRWKLVTDKRNLAKQYKQWVGDSAFASRTKLYAGMPQKAEEFSGWLAKLEPKEIEAFSNKVALFCAGLNFDLAWLTSTQLDQDPELKQTVEDSILLYSLAYWRATQVQRDVKSFLAFQAWSAAPKQHKKFTYQLYNVLLEKGMATVSPTLYLASEKERFDEAVKAIRKAAEEDRGAFLKALSLDPDATTTGAATPALEEKVATPEKMATRPARA